MNDLSQPHSHTSQRLSLHDYRWPHSHTTSATRLSLHHYHWPNSHTTSVTRLFFHDHYHHWPHSHTYQQQKLLPNERLLHFWSSLKERRKPLLLHLSLSEALRDFSLRHLRHTVEHALSALHCVILHLLMTWLKVSRRGGVSILFGNSVMMFHFWN